MESLLGGIFLGWRLGANDAANVMGAAVATRMLRVHAAILLAAAFVVLGAVLEGGAGMHTYAGLTPLSLSEAVLVSVAAALAITILNLVGLPASASHASVGALLAISLLNGQFSAGGFAKVAGCWVGTPFGAALVAAVLYRLLGAMYNRASLSVFRADALLHVGLAAAGAYSAYALGANNAANVTGVFVGAGLLDVRTATVIAGASIGLGVLTCNRRVLATVGGGLMHMNAFSALTVLLAQAVAVHGFTRLGVPVSTTQATVGAILGVGIVRGINTLRPRMILQVLAGWCVTPLLAYGMALLLHGVMRMHASP